MYGMAARDFEGEIWDIITNCTHMDDYEDSETDLMCYLRYTFCADIAQRGLDYLHTTKLRELQQN